MPLDLHRILGSLIDGGVMSRASANRARAEELGAPPPRSTEVEQLRARLTSLAHKLSKFIEGEPIDRDEADSLHHKRLDPLIQVACVGCEPVTLTDQLARDSFVKHAVRDLQPHLVEAAIGVLLLSGKAGQSQPQIMPPQSGRLKNLPQAGRTRRDRFLATPRDWKVAGPMVDVQVSFSLALRRPKEAGKLHNQNCPHPWCAWSPREYWHLYCV